MGATTKKLLLSGDRGALGKNKRFEGRRARTFAPQGGEGKKCRPSTNKWRVGGGKRRHVLRRNVRENFR